MFEKAKYDAVNAYEDFYLATKLGTFCDALLNVSIDMWDPMECPTFKILQSQVRCFILEKKKSYSKPQNGYPKC